MKLIGNAVIFLMFSFVFGQGFWGNEFPEQKIEYNPKNYVCYKTEHPLIIDGEPNESVWGKVEWTEPFVDIEGSLKPDPFYNTKVKMLWDDNYFYFYVQMEDPHLWATITERDAVVYKDNDFEIF
jgi:Domain of unknown function (DUF1083).